MQATARAEDTLKAVSTCVDSNGEEHDTLSRTSVGERSPAEVGPHLTADRGEDEDASALKKVDSLRDADSVTSTSSIFEEVDEMRFRNTLLEVLEELKMRRQQDMETEESIGSLLDAKTTLEHLVEEGRRRAEQLQEQLDRQEGEMRRSYELQLKELEAERAKASSTGGVEEKEMKALKDEVKILQMERLGLERKLKESERKVQMLASSRESILSQMAQLGQKCSAVKKQVDEATLQLESVEKSVHVAEERCQKLIYLNNHQECQLEQARQDLEQCKRRLLDAQVQSRGDPLLQGEGTGAAAAAAKGNKLRAAEKELKMERELTGQLEQQLTELRRDHQRVVAALCKAHKLVDSHVDCNVRQTESLAQLEGELEAVKEREEEAKLLLSTTAEELEQLKGRVDMSDAEWQAKLLVVEDKLSVVKDELVSLRGRYQGLVEEHGRVEEARQALEQSAKGEASLLSDKLECLRCELSEKQRLLDAREKELEVEHASSQRRLLQLERALDEKHKEVQSLKLRVEEMGSRDEKWTQTEGETCMTGEDETLVGGGVSQPKAAPFGGMSEGVVSPPAVPLPPTLSPELLVSPKLQDNDMVRFEVVEEVTEVEGPVASGDLPSEPAKCDTSKPPSQQQGQQNGGGGDMTGQGSNPSREDMEDTTAAPSSPDVPPTANVCSPLAHTKVPTKRPSPAQTKEGREDVVSCKRAKQECEGAEEGQCSPAHNSHLPATSEGSPANHPPTADEDDRCATVYQKTQIILSDSDDDIITSSLAESICSVQKFLKRDRLKRSKVPLFKV